MNRTPAAAPATATAAEVAAALGDGRAVVLPNPAPLTRVVAGRRAPAVNEAKGRPAAQPVALWAHHPETRRALDGVWDLPADRLPFVHRLLTEEHLTVLLPVRADAALPGWAAPAVQDGWMLLFGARWEPLRPLLDPHPVLYVSSANRTGQPPAATAADALAMFPPTVPVLPDPDPAPDPVAGVPTTRRATTTVRLHPDGTPALHRHGAQDAGAPDAAHYLRGLAARLDRPVTGPNSLRSHRS
ncbi:hypothetical protein ACIQBJ_13680 [Kitasatospora sp. NPDC088391]|uniref:hypothetical protein n=1 Tax=Kitasatospora sp. NPDC088391 TaxID=3364074 RepID=UPI0037F1098E